MTERFDPDANDDLDFDLDRDDADGPEEDAADLGGGPEGELRADLSDVEADGDGPRRFEKRDRLARMLRVVAVLRGHPEGIRPADVARRVGVATRTVYRDLRAL